MAQLPGRILALDFGKRRIGLALSDPFGLTAQPMPTYVRTRVREDIAFLARLAKQQDVTLFLFGDPKYMSGDLSRQSEAVREFAGRLQQLSGLPVEFWDERLTSSQAHRVLDEYGMSREQRKGKVDQLAATLILEGYLQSLDHQ